jgi:hypothetical protein
MQWGHQGGGVLGSKTLVPVGLASPSSTILQCSLLLSAGFGDSRQPPNVMEAESRQCGEVGLREVSCWEPKGASTGRTGLSPDRKAQHGHMRRRKTLPRTLQGVMERAGTGEGWAKASTCSLTCASFSRFTAEHRAAAHLLA